MSEFASLRARAHQILMHIDQREAYSHIALGASLEREPRLSPRDRALLTELVYGPLTWRRTIDEALLGPLIKRPLGELDPLVLTALRVVSYQLGWLDRVPSHAAVHEAVEDVKQQLGQRAAGFVNGVSRSLQRFMSEKRLRERGDVGHALDGASLGLRWSLPDWIAQRLVAELGAEEAARWAQAFARRPPLWARRVGASPVEAAIRLDGGVEAAAEVLSSGQLVIQDLGSQRVGQWASARGASRVLDACAGLGGKTLQLAGELDEDGLVFAVEPRRSKLHLLERAAATHGVSERVRVVQGRLEALTQELGPSSFDVVLVDAPCTGLGVLARHPETRWRKRPEDIASLAGVQSALLDAAAPLVKPGGALVYSVCTWTRQEGPAQRDAFLARHQGWRVEAPEPWPFPELLVDQGRAMRTSPPDHDCDAFWAMRLVREV